MRKDILIILGGLMSKQGRSREDSGDWFERSQAERARHIARGVHLLLNTAPGQRLSHAELDGLEERFGKSPDDWFERSQADREEEVARGVRRLLYGDD